MALLSNEVPVMKASVVILLFASSLFPIGLVAQAQLSVSPPSVEIGITSGSTYQRSIDIVSQADSLLQYSLLDLPPQLIPDQMAYHPFNDSFIDLFTHDIGQNTNTSFGTDRYDHYHGAASFNGTSSWSQQDFHLQNTFSISFWGNPEADGTQIGEGYYAYAIYGKYLLGADWGGTGNRAGLGIALSNQGIMVIEHAHGYMPCLLSYPANLSGWHHYTIVFQNHRPSLYVDGVWVRNGLVSQREITYLSHVYGSYVYGSYIGFMDDLSLFRTALSPGQITMLSQYSGSSRYGFSPGFGTVAAGASAPVTLSMLDSTLPVGIYNDTITLCQAGSNPQFVSLPIALNISSYGPNAPVDLSITLLEDGDFRLEWSPVTQDTNGQFYTPMQYHIYGGLDPAQEESFNLLGSSSETTYRVDSDSLPASPGRYFFVVKAE